MSEAQLTAVLASANEVGGARYARRVVCTHPAPAAPRPRVHHFLALPAGRARIPPLKMAAAGRPGSLPPASPRPLGVSRPCRQPSAWGRRRARGATVGRGAGSRGKGRGDGTDTAFRGAAVLRSRPITGRPGLPSRVRRTPELSAGRGAAGGGAAGEGRSRPGGESRSEGQGGAAAPGQSRLPGLPGQPGGRAPPCPSHLQAAMIGYPLPPLPLAARESGWRPLAEGWAPASRAQSSREGRGDLCLWGGRARGAVCKPRVAQPEGSRERARRAGASAAYCRPGGHCRGGVSLRR